MSERMTIEALRSRLGGEILERARTGRGGLLIDLADLGLVREVLKRMPRDRLDDIIVVSPGDGRWIGLLPDGAGDRLLAVLHALDPALVLERSEREALQVFASHTPDSTAARATDIRPGNVRNRALALLFRLIEELHSPTWNCASEAPHALHELVERVLPSLLSQWADPTAAPLLFAPSAEPSSQPLILVEHGTLAYEGVPLLLTLALSLASPADTYIAMRGGASGQITNRAALALPPHCGLMVEVDEDGMAQVPAVLPPNDAADRAWAEGRADQRLGVLLTEYSRLKHGADPRVVADGWLEEAEGLVAQKVLFQADARWACEMLARCPVPARLARNLIDRVTSKPTIAFDFIDLLAPLLSEAADRILSADGGARAARRAR
jgi:hypothetical protein